MLRAAIEKLTRYDWQGYSNTNSERIFVKLADVLAELEKAQPEKKPKRPELERCPLCDEWYDPNGERAKIHEHPEPQSGPERAAWFASGLSWEEYEARKHGDDGAVTQAQDVQDAIARIRRYHNGETSQAIYGNNPCQPNADWRVHFEYAIIKLNDDFQTIACHYLRNLAPAPTAKE